MTSAEELVALKAKRAASEGRPGYAARIAEIDKRVAELEADDGEAE